MAKKRKRIDNRQQSLFSLLKKSQELRQQISEGSLNVREKLRLACCAAIKQCSLSRWEIAGQMSHLLGVEITKYMIDAWTAESKNGHRMPGEYVPAFCKVTGSLEPLHVLAEAAGLFALPGPDALRSEIQRLDEDAKRIRQKKQKRMLFLKEMEKKR